MFDIDRLFTALASVLEGDLEPEIELFLGEHGQVGAYGALHDKFAEATRATVRRTGSLETLVSFLGKSRALRVLKEVTGKPAPMQSTAALGKTLATALGLPDLCVRGRKYQLGVCRVLCQQLCESPDNDGQVAALARTFAERLLREVALVAAGTPLVASLLYVVQNDKALRRPAAFLKGMIDASQVRVLLADEDVGDLGFFNHLLYRATSHASSGAPQMIAPLDSRLMFSDEFKAWDTLARALHPYVHFKPSRDDKRAQELRNALDVTEVAVQTMASRRIIPDAAVLFEKSEGIFGTFYDGCGEGFAPVRLSADAGLPLGCRVIYREISNPERKIVGAIATPWK
jgi:hypothetical protein